MQTPDIQTLFNKTKSIYKLVILAARRTIELSEGAAKLVDAPPDAKAMNITLAEIAQDKITYKVKGEK